jgi:lysophospholipase L1-like esterase
MKRRLLTTGAALAIAIGTLAAASPASPASARPSGHPRGWVGTWEAAIAQDTADSFANYSIRNVVHLSLGGSATRIRLSNRFGTGPLVFGHVTVAVQVAGGNSANAVPGSVRDVTFTGRRAVTARAGGDVLSDPVALPVAAQANLLVTVYLPASPAGSVTYHGLAEQTSYLSPTGDHAADPSGTAYTQQTSSWFFVTGVDVRDPVAAGSVVTLGDSITDGALSSYGANHRWPDVLARRLLALPAHRQLGVQNAGISGNRLLLPGNPPVFGPSALSRLDGDVLSRTGVRTVIVMEGINDIQQSPHQTDPKKIEAALLEIAARAHGRGLRVIGATLTPFEGWTVYDATLEATRQAVNDFIRTSRAYDAVVDFDRVVRDPADPHRMLPAYDSGDHLHPGDAGYQAMGDAVDLSRL